MCFGRRAWRLRCGILWVCGGLGEDFERRGSCAGVVGRREEVRRCTVVDRLLVVGSLGREDSGEEMICRKVVDWAVKSLPKMRSWCGGFEAVISPLRVVVPRR